MKYSKAQIAIMARAVGWGERSSDVAEVAMAESGGDSTVVNSIGCVGLLQINQPVHVKAHPKWTRSWLQNAMNNLSAGLVLYKAAGSKFDGPWLDSRDKGGGGGWGGKVSGSSGGTGAVQVGDDPCDVLKGTPGYDYCVRDRGDSGPTSPLDSVGEVADQVGRLAQAVAKAGNWAADPHNWVRVAYVTGGALLALVAVNIVARPYMMRAYGQVRGALPVKTTRDVARQLRRNPSSQE